MVTTCKSKQLSPADELCNKAVETLNKVLAEIKPNRLYLDNHDHQNVIKCLYYIRTAIECKYLIHACDYYNEWKKEVDKVKESLSILSMIEVEEVMKEVASKQFDYSKYDDEVDDSEYDQDEAYRSSCLEIKFDADKEYEADRTERN